MLTNRAADVTALAVPANVKSLQRLVKSRDKYYPGLPLLIAGEPSVDAEHMDFVRAAPDDATVPARLNSLLARVRTPYCVVVQGDAHWRRRSRLWQLIEPLRQQQYDLVSGQIGACQRRWLVLTQQQPITECGVWDLQGSQLTLQPILADRPDDATPCDFGASYFAARTDKLRSIGGWDEQLGESDHLELYLRASRYDLRVAVVTGATLSRWDGPVTGSEISTLAVEKMGLTRCTTLSGASISICAPAKAA